VSSHCYDIRCTPAWGLQADLDQVQVPAERAFGRGQLLVYCSRADQVLPGAVEASGREAETGTSRYFKEPTPQTKRRLISVFNRIYFL